jgi:hypothetical protein
MFCPNCESPNLCKLSLVYESGTTLINAKSVGGGVGYGAGGVLGGVGIGKTSGVQQTTTAIRAAPPKKRDWGGAVVGAIVFLILVQFSGWWGIAALVCTANAISAIQFNRTQWSHLYAAWDAAYLCERCGTMAAPTRVPVSQASAVYEIPKREDAEIQAPRAEVPLSS